MAVQIFCILKKVIAACASTLDLQLLIMALKVPKANNLQIFKEGYKVNLYSSI